MINRKIMFKKSLTSVLASLFILSGCGDTTTIVSNASDKNTSKTNVISDTNVNSEIDQNITLIDQDTIKNSVADRNFTTVEKIVI